MYLAVGYNFMIKTINQSVKQILISMQSGSKGGKGQSSSQKKHRGDRFIPHTVAKNLFNTKESKQIHSDSKYHSDTKHYSQLLGERLFQPNEQISKILRFGQATDKQNQNTNIIHNTNQIKSKLSHQPYKILDAPLLKDDFYLNLVDWSDSKLIAVGLESSVYIWSGCASKVIKAFQFDREEESICSLAFLKGNNKMAVGLNHGEVAVFDLHRQTMIGNAGTHLGRVGSVGCTGSLVCSGGRDGYVSIRDVRQDAQVFRYRAHEQQICGLKVSPAGDMVATGGNDNKLHLFSLRRMETLVSWSNHRAAVKAIGFNPNDPSIASGGGSADRRIRIFSLHTLEMQNEVDTGSQICNLMYSSISNELVTTHGYSLNQINLWRWGQGGSLEKVDSLMGHKKRVLYLAGEEQGNKVVTGAGDEELRLWKVFDGGRNRPSYDLR